MHYKEKRAITLDEQQKIITAEVNLERKAFYQLCWHLSSSQGDIAQLEGEDVDWANITVSFFRKKTPVLVHLGREASNVLRDLPVEGLLFPYFASVRATGPPSSDNVPTTRNQGGVRYAWAERAKSAGYPERFAQEALGHNSKAVHRAYAERALVNIPSLEEYERRVHDRFLRIARVHCGLTGFYFAITINRADVRYGDKLEMITTFDQPNAGVRRNVGFTG